MLVNYKLVHFYSSAYQQIISTQKINRYFQRFFLMTPLIQGLNENFWYMASSLYIPFILSATCLFRLVLVWKACVTSSRNCHGLLKAKETTKKYPSTFPLLLLFRGEAVIGHNAQAVLGLTRPLQLQAQLEHVRDWEGGGEREKERCKEYCRIICQRSSRLFSQSKAS